jgi:IS5 family transposase
MGQLEFFDADKRLAAHPRRGDPLEAIDRLVPWETFRADIEAVVLTPKEMRKSSAGRKPLDAIVLFRVLILQALNNLSDEQAEYQLRAEQTTVERREQHGRPSQYCNGRPALSPH